VNFYLREHNDHPNELQYPFMSEVSNDGSQYGFATCLSVNDEIVHSRPSNRLLEDGDVITIDCGLSLNGYCSDIAHTVCISSLGKYQNMDPKVVTLFKALALAIDRVGVVCRPGNRLGHIAEVIAKTAAVHRLGNIINFGGHGIGRSLHEVPYIPNAPGISTWDDLILRPGMSFCVEPMFTLGGSSKIAKKEDGWTILTADGSIAAHEERHIIITEEGCEILTDFYQEKE
jgi:methionyl aminopeptidase